MENNDLYKALDQFGYELVIEMVNELRRLGKVASGDLVNSMTYDLFPGVKDTFEIDIISNEYAQYVDKGRKAGKRPPLGAIKRWAEIKGIDQKYVYPIAKKIGEKGIAPTNFISKVLADNKQKYLDIIRDSYAKDIELKVRKEIKDEVKDINNKNK